MQVYEIQHRDGAWRGPWPTITQGKTLVLAFGGRKISDDDAAWSALRDATAGAVIAGCSTSGEIAGVTVSDDTISAAIVVFDDATVRVAALPVEGAAASEAVGRQLGAQLAATPGLRAVMVFSDGLAVNGTRLAAGIDAAVPAGTIVSGGLAGDGDRFESTWVVVDGAPRGGHVVAVGLYGESLELGVGSRGGWDPFGPDRVVTRSEGNVLYELDGRPALALYKEYLGERAVGLPATALLFPLMLLDRGDSGGEIVRTVLAVDDAANSMTFAGDIPHGSRCRLMRANFDRLVDGAGDAVAATMVNLAGGSPVLCVAISCVGRRLVLGERVEEEVEACFEALPAGSVQVGFYSYGELSPLGLGSCDLHNQTMTLTAIRER